MKFLQDSLINDFITDFKKQYPKEIEDLFSNGYCYWFAIILSKRFYGEIYYLPIENHFITFINNNFYDIKGIVRPLEIPYKWSEYKAIDELEYNRIIRDCVNKERLN